MRRIFIALIALAAAAPLLAQQQPAAKKGKTVTLSGCVEKSATKAGEYTLTADDTDAATYRLTGTDVRDYVGKRVEVVGIPPKIAVKGGLYPTPNVAAQAGAMDPSKAAVAAATAGPAAATAGPLPEFRIQAIKPVLGKCPEPDK